MDLTYVLIFYILFLFILIFILSKYGIQTWSAIIIAIIICWVLLNILMPPNKVDDEDISTSLYALYFLIQFLSIIIVIIYALVCASKDYKSDYITIKIHSKHIDNSKPFIEVI